MGVPMVLISGTLTILTPTPTPYPTPIAHSQVSKAHLALSIPDNNSWVYSAIFCHSDSIRCRSKRRFNSIFY